MVIDVAAPAAATEPAAAARPVPPEGRDGRSALVKMDSVSRAELDSLALWEQMDGEAEEDLEPYSYGTEGAALAEEGTLLHMNSDELLLLALPPLLLLGAPLIIRGTCRAHT